ncbi:hypothetical protein ACFYOG_33085 [Streptomyces sp. NPDC007818]|uniref:hypothetical protein n=1 Tax=Streptomyces sp. NPDC007818 TaxID=3364780 RepID=UPI00369A583F
MNPIRKMTLTLAVSATLGLGAVVPASADDVELQSVVGTGYQARNFGGGTVALEDTGGVCEELPNRILSARNTSGPSGPAIAIYANGLCLVPLITLEPGEEDNNLDPLNLWGGANHYRTIN